MSKLEASIALLEANDPTLTTLKWVVMRGRKEEEQKVKPTFVSVCHSLRDNGVGAEGCKALAAALQTNATLTSLGWVMLWGRVEREK
jgi:hypothetical protein